MAKEEEDGLGVEEATRAEHQEVNHEVEAEAHLATEEDDVVVSHDCLKNLEDLVGVVDALVVAEVEAEDR